MIWSKEETLPRAELEALQLERLQKTVARVYDKVAPYRAKMDAVGIKPEDIKTLSDLAKFGVEHGFSKIFIADPHGGESCFECPGLFERSVIVIGGEPNGVMGSCADAGKVVIPMPGDYESINAAQAATVLLFESVRRKMSLNNIK